MVLTLAGWVLVYFLTSVFGFWLLKVVDTARPLIHSQTERVLAGLIGLVAAVQMISIVAPADYRMVPGLLIVALLVNWRLGNEPVRLAVDSLRSLSREPLAWLLLLVVLLFTLGKASNYDSGLYHIPAIRWYERYRAIPGLGNLHGRLAFNSSFFVLSAALSFTALVGQPLYCLNSFVFLLFGGYVIQGFRRPEAVPGLRLFRLLLLGLASYQLAYQISSPTPDVWATLLPLFLFLFWLDGLPADNRPRLLLWLGLVLLCLTVKLGTVPLLLFPLLYVVLHGRSLDLKLGLAAVGIGVLLVGPWLVRNVILSGYLLYPFPALDLFSVDWKIPLSAVNYEQDYVTFWARYHLNEIYLDPVRLNWPLQRWVPAWWQMQGDPQTYMYYKLNRPIVVLAGVSPVVMLVQWVRNRRSVGPLVAPYAVALAGFLFWFLKAPEFRFGYAFVWTTALLPWIPLLGWLASVRLTRLPIVRLAYALLLCFLATKLVRLHNPLSARTLVVANWYGYKEHDAEGVGLRAHQTQSGLTVLVPNPSPLEQQCFEVDQPCSPYLFSNLEKRGATWQEGFRRRPSTNQLSQSQTSYVNEIQRNYPGLQ